MFIVKCAFGGTSLYQDWLSPSGGAAYDESAYVDTKELHGDSTGAGVRAGWCYNELIRIVQYSIALLKNEGYVPCITAFCWMQGESDACTKEAVEKYVGLYDALLIDFQKEFSAYLSDTCAVIDGGISETWPFFVEMNKVKKDYAKTHQNCYYIDTIDEGLTVSREPDEEPDIAHYDSDGIIKLGWLFAQRIAAHIAKGE